MSLDQKRTFSALQEWFQTDQGKDIANAFTAELRPLSRLLHGDMLLQLGDCKHNFWLDLFQYTHKWITNPFLQSTSAFVADFNSLPLPDGRIDCIIAPMTLYIAQKREQVLDEIDRVLQSMGYVIFLGPNLFSLWGPFMPFSWSCAFRSLKNSFTPLFVIKRMMLYRGYTQRYLSHFYFLPPVHNKKWLSRFDFLNEIGKMMWPCSAGFYCLVMQKLEENSHFLWAEETSKALINRKKRNRIPMPTSFH